MKTSRHTLYSAIILFFITLWIPLSDAQLQATTFNSNVAQLIKEVPWEEKYTNAGAVIILKEMIMSVEKGGLYNSTMHVAGKIFNEKARSDYGQIAIYFNSYYEEITLNFAHTIGKDGRVTEISKDAIEIKTRPESSGIKRYTEIKALAFSLPALEVGATFEYQVTKRQKIPVIKDNWFKGFYFNHIHWRLTRPFISRIDQVYKSRFVLNLPKGERFRYQIKNIEVSPMIKKEKDFVSYVWEMNNLPDIIIEEGMPDIDEIIPELQLSSLKGWNEVDEWISGCLFPILEVTREIESKVKGIIDGVKTEEEKIEALFYFIQDNIEYVAADLNRSGYIPHKPVEVLKNRYGDCKDQAALFLTMLKSIGITAYPALIYNYSHRKVENDPPSPRSFAHIIIYISRKEGDLWLDTTSAFTKFPYLHWSDQDRWVLVVDGKGGRFLKTPSSKPEDNLLEIETHFDFKDEILIGKMTIEGKGAKSENLKSLLISMRNREQQDFIRELIEYAYPDSQVKTIEFSDLEDPVLPFRVAVQFEFKDLGVQAEQTFFYYESYPLTFSLYNWLFNITLPERRKNDYLLNFKSIIVESKVYSPPTKDFKPGILPLDRSLDTNFISFNRKYGIEGNGVKERFELILKEKRINKEEYEEFYQFVQEVRKKSEKHRVFFEKSEIDETGERLENIVRENSEDVTAILNLSKHYLAVGKYESAKELLEKAMDLEPNNGEIHYFIGIAFGYIGQYEKTREKIEMAKELGYKP